MVFPVVMYGYKSWTVEKAEHRRTDAFELWWMTLESPLGSKEIKPVNQILKKINPEYSLKDWCWSWSCSTSAAWWEELTHGKGTWCWERLRAGGERSDRGWDGWMHHWLNEHEFEQTLGDSEGQGSLVSCSLWLQRVGHNWATEKQQQNS